LLVVGLNYLTLGRTAKTLSGGEAQRIRLATQIGSQLVNVCFYLYEPRNGLHKCEHERLINARINHHVIVNTKLVVEHDNDMNYYADHVIDMEPDAGVHDGTVVAEGSPKEILHSDSLTAAYLNGKKAVKIPEKRREGNGKTLTLYGATGH